MESISTKVKKLNIIQKIRRNIFIFRIKKIDAEKYEKAPEYIKGDRQVVEKLCDRIINGDKYENKIGLAIEDKNLLDKLPNPMLFQYISQKPNGKYILSQLSNDKKNSLAADYPEFISQ